MVGNQGLSGRAADAEAALVADATGAGQAVSAHSGDDQPRWHDAELRDWHIEIWGGNAIAFGAIYNDSKTRFRDGDRVRTSKVVSRERDRCQTLNTKYLLVGPEIA